MIRRLRRTLYISVAAVLLIIASFVSGCSGIALEPIRAEVHRIENSDGVGSGVVISPGLFLTAEHVAKLPDLRLRAGGATGKVIALGDEKLDLGLLYFPRSEAACPCVTLAASDADVDEPVYVIGYPLGIARVVTVGTSQGVVESASVASMFGNIDLGRRLVMTAPASPGNSGGGVFVLRGGKFQLVGILVEGSGSLTFAVPVSDIKAFLAKNV